MSLARWVSTAVWSLASRKTSSSSATAASLHRPGDLVTTVHDLLARRREAVETVPLTAFSSRRPALPGQDQPSKPSWPIKESGGQVPHRWGDHLVNAPHIVQQLQEHPEASAQLGYADHIIVNHCDQCDAEALAAAEGAVLACNPHATRKKPATQTWQCQRCCRCAHGKR